MTDRSGTGSASPKQSVLVIDDDAGNLAVLSDFLGKMDLTVLVAEDGGSGIERARYVLPDLVLLDVMLPDVDGYAVCRNLKADPKTADIPVIFLTALAESEFVLKGFDAGCVDYIMKPLKGEEVLARVGVHLRISALANELRVINETLEKKVEERTRELADSVRKLKDDIARRVRLERELKKLVEEKKGLLRELHHRVKNNLQLIESILDLSVSKDGAGNHDAVINGCHGRIAAMALVHEELARSEDMGSIDFRGCIDETWVSITSLYDNWQGIGFVNNTDSVLLPIEQATPCSLLLNELVTNAVRHAFPPGWAGTRLISVSMSKDGDEIVLDVSDTGVGIPDGFEVDTVATVGMQIIRALARQMEGTMRVENRPGACFCFRFPASLR